MGDDNFLIVLGVILVFPFVVFFLKVWKFATGTPGSTYQRVQRISELDAHLSFEDRLAEKLRAAGEEEAGEVSSPPPQSDTPSPAPSPAPAPAPFAAPPAAAKGFGRRGL